MRCKCVYRCRPMSTFQVGPSCAKCLAQIHLCSQWMHWRRSAPTTHVTKQRVLPRWSTCDPTNIQGMRHWSTHLPCEFHANPSGDSNQMKVQERIAFWMSKCASITGLNLDCQHLPTLFKLSHLCQQSVKRWKLEDHSPQNIAECMVTMLVITLVTV